MFGWRGVDVELFDQKNFLLAGDDGSQSFILLAEADKHMQSPGYDHLGILCDTARRGRRAARAREEVARQGRPRADPRVREGPRHRSGHRARVLRALLAADPVRRAVHRVRRGLRARRSVGRTPERSCERPADRPDEPRRRPARQPEPSLPRLLPRRDRAARTAHGDGRGGLGRPGTGRDAEHRPARGADHCASTSTGRDRCRACPPATTCSSVRSTSCGGRGARSRSGRTRSPTTCGARGSRRCSCPTIRTCSRSAARTTTPISPPGTTCAGTRVTRGAHAPIRRGRARPRSRPSRLRASRPTTTRGRGSAPRATSPGRARCGGRASGCATSAPTTSASCCSSTSSIRTSRSTRPSRGRALRRGRGKARGSSGRRTRRETIAKGRLDRARGPPDPRQLPSKLAMIDHWLGRILDALDDAASWDDTAVVLCTDHGHYLGERDAFGKPGIPVYADLGHTPLLIAWPGVDAGHGRRAHDQRRPARDVARRVRRRARAPHARPLARPADRRRDDVGARVGAAGVWGRDVHVVERERRLHPRARRRRTSRSSMWSNRWSTMPVHARPELRLPRPDGRAALAACPAPTCPVIRQPFDARRLPAVLGRRRVHR